MKSTILAPFILILMFSVPVTAGPFGTEMGMTKEQLGITSSTEEIATYRYKLATLPKTSPLFEYYVVEVSPRNGLCYLKAIGNNVSTSRYGNELRRMFDRVNSSLERKYTSGTISDFLRSGSIWDEPEDFMMGLTKRERVLAAYYDEEEGSVMVENVAKAYLNAKGLGSDTGFIVIDYFYDNSAACDAEIEAVQDDVF